MAAPDRCPSTDAEHRLVAPELCLYCGPLGTRREALEAMYRQAVPPWSGNLDAEDEDELGEEYEDACAEAWDELRVLKPSRH